MVVGGGEDPDPKANQTETLIVFLRTRSCLKYSLREGFLSSKWRGAIADVFDAHRFPLMGYARVRSIDT